MKAVLPHISNGKGESGSATRRSPFLYSNYNILYAPFSRGYFVAKIKSLTNNKDVDTNGTK